MITSFPFLSAYNRSFTFNQARIESLLIASIEDHRKYALWRILAPYLVKIKKLSCDEAFIVIKDWLNKCDDIAPLDFNPNDRIKSNLRAALRVGYLPISINDLKLENKELYNLISRALGNVWIWDR